MTDKITELHALAVLDVLTAADAVIEAYREGIDRLDFRYIMNDLDNALYRLDRLEVTTGVAA